MITKGIIIDKIVSEENSNKYLVRIPFLETPANKSTNKKTDTYYEATVNEEPSLHQSYKKDDVVYVGFEDHSTDKPIIIGKLSLKTNALEPRSYSNLQALEVSTSAVLPQNTSIGEVDGDRFLNAVRTAENLDYGVKDLNSLEIKVKEIYLHYQYNGAKHIFTPALVINTYPISKAVINLVKNTVRVRIRLKEFKKSTKRFGFIRTLHPDARDPDMDIDGKYLDNTALLVKRKHLKKDNSGNCYIHYSIELSDYYTKISEDYMRNQYEITQSYLTPFNPADHYYAEQYLGTRWYSLDISNQSQIKYAGGSKDSFERRTMGFDDKDYYYWKPNFNAVGFGDDRNDSFVHNYGLNCRYLSSHYDLWKEYGSQVHKIPSIYENEDGMFGLNHLKKSKYYITYFTSSGIDSFSNLLGNHMFRKEVRLSNRNHVIQFLDQYSNVKGQNLNYSWHRSNKLASDRSSIRPHAQRDMFGIDFAILTPDYRTTYSNMWMHESEDSGYLYCAKFYTYAVKNNNSTRYDYEYFVRSWLQQKN